MAQRAEFAVTGRTRVFQIGFNKCGTRTINFFFQNNGFHGIHWHRGRLARAMFDNMWHGRSLIHGYEEFDVFTDMEFITPKGSLEAFKLFPYMATEFPDALFILNTRDREAWIRSRILHKDGVLLEAWKQAYGVSSKEEVTARWRDDWDRHHERVRHFFSGSPYRLLVFDIEQDPPERLTAAFPQISFDMTKYGRRGDTSRRLGQPLPAIEST